MFYYKFRRIQLEPDSDAFVRFNHFRLQKSVEERLRKHLTITEVAIQEPEDEEEDVIALPVITPEMEKVITNAMASSGQVRSSIN